MNKKLKNLLQFLFFFGGGIVISWWQYYSMDAEQKVAFLKHLNNIDYTWVPIILLMAICSHYLRALRWSMLLEPLGSKPKTFDLFAATMIGYLANSFVPRLGEVIKCTLVSKTEKIKFESIIGTIVVERIIDLLTFFLFVLITLATQYNRISSFVTNELGKNFSTNKLVILIIIIIIIIIAIYGLTNLAKKNKDNKFIAKLNSFKEGTIQGFTSIKNLKKPTLFWLYTIGIWSMYIFQMYLSFNVITATENLPFAASLTCLFATTIAMIAMPNGLGVMPPLIASALVLYNIPIEAGEALGWMSWAFSSGTICVVAIICIGIMALRKNKN